MGGIDELCGQLWSGVRGVRKDPDGTKGGQGVEGAGVGVCVCVCGGGGGGGGD